MISLIRGVKDIYPDEYLKWQSVYSKAKEIFNKFNYQEILTPIIEKTELFVRSVGISSDIVNKEMYTFNDRSGESITLRPEATASVMRAYLNNPNYRDKFEKLWYWGPMYRHERPQKGRYRQFYQFGLEAINSSSAYIDAELMYLLDYFFSSLGISDLNLQVNSVGCNVCRPIYIEKLKAYYKDNINKLCNDCKLRLEQNPLRILDCKEDSCKALLVNAPTILDYLCVSCKPHFDAVKDNLKALNINFILNPYLVRGLDYYTKTVFEFISKDLGARQNALGGGGRYDNLSIELGSNKAIPSVGFACGIERLIMLLTDKSKENNSIYLALLDEISLNALYKLILELKKEFNIYDDGFKIFNIKKHLEKALKLDFKYLIIVGADDIKNNRIIFKNLKDKTQKELSTSNYNNLKNELEMLLKEEK